MNKLITSCFLVFSLFNLQGQNWYSSIECFKGIQSSGMVFQDGDELKLLITYIKGGPHLSLISFDNEGHITKTKELQLETKRSHSLVTEDYIYISTQKNFSPEGLEVRLYNKDLEEESLVYLEEENGYITDFKVVNKQFYLLRYHPEANINYFERYDKQGQKLESIVISKSGNSTSKIHSIGENKFLLSSYNKSNKITIYNADLTTSFDSNIERTNIKSAVLIDKQLHILGSRIIKKGSFDSENIHAVYDRQGELISLEVLALNDSNRIRGYDFADDNLYLLTKPFSECQNGYRLIKYDLRQKKELASKKINGDSCNVAMGLQNFIKTDAGIAIPTNVLKDGISYPNLMYCDFDLNAETEIQNICKEEYLDEDGDGVNSLWDCDDHDSRRSPKIREIYYNGIDDDCNLYTVDDDRDRDGFSIDEDCDDTNKRINPKAKDILDNGIDENCDGEDSVTINYELSGAKISFSYDRRYDRVKFVVTGDLEYAAQLVRESDKKVLAGTHGKYMRTVKVEAGTYLLEIRDKNSSNMITERIVIEK